MTDPDEEAIAQQAGTAKVTGVSGVFRLLMAEHGEVFASAKRAGTPSRELDASPRVERFPHDRCEVDEVYAVLREVVEAEPASHNDAPPSDLADAVAVLDATNPSSPEWGPAFLQLSELVEARVVAEESEPRTRRSSRTG